VTIGLLYGDFIFDSVLTILYDIKIVASIFKVQYEHKKTKCGGLCICVCFKFPGVSFCQELAKFDDI